MTLSLHTVRVATLWDGATTAGAFFFGVALGDVFFAAGASFGAASLDVFRAVVFFGEDGAEALFFGVDEGVLRVAIRKGEE